MHWFSLEVALHGTTATSSNVAGDDESKKALSLSSSVDRLLTLFRGAVNGTTRSSTTQGSRSQQTTGAATDNPNDSNTLVVPNVQEIRISPDTLYQDYLQQQERQASQDTPGAFQANTNYFQRPRFAALFVPTAEVDSALEEYNATTRELFKGKGRASRQIERRQQQQHVVSSMISTILLSRIHPYLARNFLIQAIFSYSSSNTASAKLGASLMLDRPNHAPADVVLLDLQHAPAAAVADLLDHGVSMTSGRNTLSAASDANANVHPSDRICKILLISTVNLCQKDPEGAKSLAVAGLLQKQQPRVTILPSCPVCLHRIDPVRLGLPKPSLSMQCSKFCPLPTEWLTMMAKDPVNAASHCPCPNQRQLHPWSAPNFCSACHIIQTYWWKGAGIRTDGKERKQEEELAEIFCYDCAMQETLWACLTCGFVGCGRYSNKHAEQHWLLEGHAYSLELATGRIWDYGLSEFAHRVDFLECPCSPPSALKSRLAEAAAAGATAGISSSTSVMPATSSAAARRSTSFSDQSVDFEENKDADYGGGHEGRGGPAGNSCASSGAASRSAAYLFRDATEKSPKKATMIGEEYEALLQSALEEQAQHYEGEISRLRATLTAEQVDMFSMSEKEQEEIDRLRDEIAHLRTDTDSVSRELLDLQSEEAGHRATCQKLLREQQMQQDLLKQLQQETATEHEQGVSQMEELEQQITDLTANQRMREEVLKGDQELLYSHIVATSSEQQNQQSSSKRGKKSRRRMR